MLMQRKWVQVWGYSRHFKICSEFLFAIGLKKPLCMNSVKCVCFIPTKKLRKFFHNILISSLWIRSESPSEPGQRKPRVKLCGRNSPSIQSDSRSINLFSIQECNCGICRIEGKLRSAVWTVHSYPYSIWPVGTFNPFMFISSVS